MVKLFIYVFLYVLSYFKFFVKKKPTKPSIAILRLDLIGDYLLFHNFVKYLVQSKKYQGYKFILIGNLVWKDLAFVLNKSEINEFIWIDVNQLTNKISYAIKKILELKKLSLAMLLNPVFSRNLLMDLIVKNILSDKKITYQGDYTNHRPWLKKRSDLFYDELIENPKNKVFEFYKNKFFFEKILNKKIRLNKPFIKKEISNAIKTPVKLPKSFAIFFIGASQKKRIWPVSHLLAVGKYLINKNGITPVILGGKKEIGLARQLYRRSQTTTNSPVSFINLTGKFSLPNLFPIIKQAKIIISNDSFLPHLAVALNSSPILVISNGNSFGRFLPYPEPIFKNYQVVFHPKVRAMRAKLVSFNELVKRYGKGSSLDIQEVTSKDVIEVLEKINLNN